MVQYSKGVNVWRDFNQSLDTSQSLIIKRIWSQVEKVLTIYKDLIWNSLINSNFNVDQPQETILSLFSKLLNLEKPSSTKIKMMTKTSFHHLMKTQS